MDTNKNSYTIIYATVMVVVVALVLALVSSALKSKQEANIALDKKKQILSSLMLDLEGKNIEDMYSKYITNEMVLNSEGKVLEEGKEVAFNIDFVKQMSLPLAERKLPVYVANVDGQTKYILSLRGNGLWGPIWGYVSLDNDKNTIFGANFSHESETPGLGAEITTKHFQNEFPGKKIMNSQGEFVSVAVVKPGNSVSNRDYVDGISGGTLTSDGVNNMLYTCIGQYKVFLEKK